jgi:4-hydroxy-tetrahydrodipicolinate reductase
MKIAILGYGRMGKEVENQINIHGHQASAIFDIGDNFCETSKLNGAEAIISFTLADSVFKNIEMAAKLNIPIVEGTTGWYDKLNRLETIENVSILYSPNFSIGVYRFTQLVERAAKLFGLHPEYDSCLHEFHHSGKADSPSGTAKKLASVVLENMPTKDKIFSETSHDVIDPKALHVTSTRVGRVEGEHIVGFDSTADDITLKHTAHSREGFAAGSVRAAEWIAGKFGIFTMEDFMTDMFPSI